MVDILIGWTNHNPPAFINKIVAATARKMVNVSLFFSLTKSSGLSNVNFFPLIYFLL
jgi:hypothetical protein